MILEMHLTFLGLKVSTLVEIPTKARAMLVLAHGAGAGMRHPAMTALAEALHSEHIATFRFQFPYMEKGSKRPDRPDVAVAAIAAAVAAAKKAAPKLPLFAGGRSFGGRMTTTAASLGRIDLVGGIICFGFPLHPAKQPGTERAAHLKKVTQPMLFIQGTRDDLSDLSLLRPIAAKNARLTLHFLEGADHSFGVLKSSGRTNAEVLAEAAHAAAEFCSSSGRRSARR
jgi:uncharacterized protein